MSALDEEIYDKKNKFEILSRQLWFDFEKTFNLRGSVLKYNKEKECVEVIDNSRKEDMEMLDKIKNKEASPYNPIGNPLPKMMESKIEKGKVWRRIKNIKIIIYGQPIPAKRVTGRSLWRAKDYAEYKEYLAFSIIKKRIAPYKGDCYINNISFYRKGNRRADIDNLLKGVLEAFQMSGLVKNDNQVVGIGGLSLYYNSDNPRVEITL